MCTDAAVGANGPAQGGVAGDARPATNDARPSADDGPVTAAAAKAGQTLAPLAEDLRARLPAAGPALDAAAKSLSRAAAASDQAYRTRVAPLLAAASRELASPEARRLRTAAVAFLAALVSVLAVYALRALAAAERALGLPTPSRSTTSSESSDETAALDSAGRAHGGPATVAEDPLYTLGPRISRVAGAAASSVAERARSSATQTQAGAAIAHFFLVVLAVVAATAHRVAGYSGEYREYIVPAATWVATRCDEASGYRGPRQPSSSPSSTTTSTSSRPPSQNQAPPSNVNNGQGNGVPPNRLSTHALPTPPSDTPSVSVSDHGKSD